MQPQQPEKRRGSVISSAPQKLARTASQPRPGPLANNLLGEAMQLSSRASSSVRRPAAQPEGGPSRAPSGIVVERLPLDLGLKKDCVVTSSASLKWCGQASLPAAQAKAIAAGEGGAEGRLAAAERLHRALTHWRYPPQRLPPSLANQLAVPGLSPVDKDYAAGLRSDWAAALHSLYFALREGRCPYFYCRGENYTLLWRNAAAPHAGAGAGAGAAEAEGGGAAADGPSAAADGRFCYAVLAPSTRGLRNELEQQGVPFSMPRAGQAAAAEDGLSAAELAGVAAEMQQVNSYANNEEMAAAKERRLASAVDGKQARSPSPFALVITYSPSASAAPLAPRPPRPPHPRLAARRPQASALLFPGHTAVSALYDYLLNKGQPHLALQLLAPSPFLHGAPRAALAAATVTAAASNAAVAGGAAEVEAAPPQHMLRVDASEACGGPLLPGALPQLCALLQARPPPPPSSLLPWSSRVSTAISARPPPPPQEETRGDFELRCASADGKHAEWLNVPPPAPPTSEERASRRQPLADLRVHEREKAAAAPPEAAPLAAPGAAAADGAEAHGQPVAIKRITCTAGVLRLLTE